MQKHRPVNDFVRYLKGEFEYWLAIITNESQRNHWQQKQLNRRKQLIEAKIQDKNTILIEELAIEDIITFQGTTIASNSTSMIATNPSPSNSSDLQDEGKINY